METDLSLNDAWDLAAELVVKLEPLTDEQTHNVIQAVNVLDTHRLSTVLVDWFIEQYRSFIANKALPQLWANLPPKEDQVTPADAHNTPVAFRFARAVEELHQMLLPWLQNVVVAHAMHHDHEKLQEINRKMVDILKACVWYEIPTHLHIYVFKTYSHCFKISRFFRIRKRTCGEAFTESDDDGLCDDEVDDGDLSNNACEQGCPMCGREVDEDNVLEPEDNLGSEPMFCMCHMLLETFDRLNDRLQALGLQEGLANDAVMSIIHAHIERHVRFRCLYDFEQLHLARLESWVQRTVVDWLRLIYHADDELVDASRERLTYMLYDVYASLRVEQLFEMIVDFPDSIAAIDDLHACLERVHGLRENLVVSLRHAFETRLLQPGVATNDILTAYIQTIKALRVLEREGVLLQLVCEPIKNYLKNKEDTVRCIITALTDEHSDLLPELVSNLGDEDGSDDECVVRNWQQWRPEPVEAKKAPRQSRAIRNSDIVSILVNVYESKDLFVEEYQRLLAQRFLSQLDCNIELERRNLELLTLKFGESDLNACEVMLNDMTTSKRLDARINSGEIISHYPSDFTTNCLVLSAQFWPPRLGVPPSEQEVATLQLPGCIQNMLVQYTKAFETIKGSRTLDWRPHLGAVELDILIGDRRVPLSVQPIHAVILMHFQDHPQWRLVELVELLGVPGSVIRRKMMYWINKGFVREVTPDLFEMLDDETILGQPPEQMAIDDEVDEYDTSTAAAEEEQPQADNEKFRIFWSFIENMLTNLNALPLERIHTMLQMFAMGSTTTNELTIQELRHFLETKVRDGKVVYSGGMYKLP